MNHEKNFLGRSLKILIILSLALLWPDIGLSEDSSTCFSIRTKYLRQGEWDKAITELDKAISLLKNSSPKPDNYNEQLAKAYNNLGLAYYEKKDYSTAQINFFQAYTNNSSDTKILSKLALAYFVQESYPLAAALYQIAISFSKGDEPYLVDVYNNLGVCYANQTSPDFAKAEEAYSNAINMTEEKNLDYMDAY